MQEIEEFRVHFLGRKGELATLMKQLADVPGEERPKLGSLANEVKREIERVLEAAEASLGAGELAARLEQEKEDITEPGMRPPQGHTHIVNQAIEEITATYVVIRLWDLRRLVVPLSHFIDRPFQNWTRQNAAILGTAILHVDYTVPVGEVRRKLEEIVRASRLWDGEVLNLKVVEAREQTIELRALFGAANSGDAFNLGCEVRERLIGFLQEHHPDALPRRRAELFAGDGAQPSRELLGSSNR
jgi:hypothetical protein